MAFTQLLVRLPGNSRRIAALLALILLVCCGLSDWLGQALQLSLPLLIGALVSGALVSWGVPRLRALKLGQVIREEGPNPTLARLAPPPWGACWSFRRA